MGKEARRNRAAGRAEKPEISSSDRIEGVSARAARTTHGALRPFVHEEAEAKSDEQLRAEAKDHLAQHASLQVVAEILIRLRVADLSWWTPEQLQARWGATSRMGWFAQRPDLRQEITTALTGLVFHTARRKSPLFQAELIDSVIQDSDIGAEHFEGAFDPRDLVVYGPVDEIWRELMARAPWHGESVMPPSLVESLLDILLADRSAAFGTPRTPILSAWDLRTAIDGRVWHTRVPLEVRIAIDDARLRQEKERAAAPFHAHDELAIATPKILAASIPFGDLRHVFTVAAAEMGLGASYASSSRSDVVLVAPPSEAVLAGE
jgi:hypothetical protein